MTRPSPKPPLRTDTRHLFGNVMRLPNDERSALRSIRTACPSVEHWRAVLSAIPLDWLSFEIRAGHRRAEVIEVLSSWCKDFRRRRSEGVTGTAAQASIFGHLSVLLITLITLVESTSSDQRANGRSSRDTLCADLVEDDCVRTALVDLYRPRAEPDENMPRLSATQMALAKQKWSRIQKDSLRFHRHGSTSFILSGRTDESHGRVALKCVLFPYADIPAIANKTLRYAQDHGSTDRHGRHVEHMIDVWASTSHWILMDFVDGCTLAEEIEQIKDEEAWRGRGTAPNRTVRLDLIRRLGIPVLDALHELHLQDKRHEDLSPTNIIVRRRTVRGDEQEYGITFIDFGKNYLYSGALSGLEGPERMYVAPEVRNDAVDTTKADLYSLGKILIALGDVDESRDSIVPDHFYDQAPLLARLIEDLVDADASQRLLVLPMTPDDKDVYRSLAVILKQELDVTQAALEPDGKLHELTVPSANVSLASTVRSVFPISREPTKQRRIYRVRRDQGVLPNPRRSMYARRLHLFSILASINYYVTTLVCFYWLLRDLGADVVNPVVGLALHAVDAGSNSIPLIDGLRRPDYHLGDIAANLPARMVALSFAFVAMRYYQNIFSGLTTRVADSPALRGAPTRVVAEWSVRVMAIWSSWLILTCNLVEVRWWPFGTAIGYTGVLVTNVTSRRFVRKYLAMARDQKLSTVPPKNQKITGLNAFFQWVPKISFLILIVWPFAILIYTGAVKDVYVYATIVVMINIGLLYVFTTGIGAGEVRIALTRCYLAAERLRYRAERASDLHQPATEQPAVVPARVDP